LQKEKERKRNISSLALSSLSPPYHIETTKRSILSKKKDTPKAKSESKKRKNVSLSLSLSLLF